MPHAFVLACGVAASSEGLTLANFSDFAQRPPQLRLKEDFQEIDTNKDGRITLEELNKASLKKGGDQVTQEDWETICGNYNQCEQSASSPACKM